MKTSALALAAALLTIPPLVASAQPPPPPAAEADSRFKRGVELYNEADYNAALIEFRRAYELDPKFQALYNIAETYYQLQNYAEALKTFQKYLKDGGAQISPGRREEVEREVGKLKNRVATLEITTSVPDVDVTIDDVPVGKTPFSAPLLVSAGRRRVTATRAGKPPVTRIVNLAGGDAGKLAITIADDATAAPVAPPPGTPPPPPPRSVPVAPWVVTGVLAAGAVVTGVLALGASSSLKTDIATYYPNETTGQQTISSAHTKSLALGLTTDILAGSAIVVGVVSIYLTVRKPDAAAPAGAASAPPSVALRVGPESLFLTGTF